jgi:TPR repeat protein
VVDLSLDAVTYGRRDKEADPVAGWGQRARARQLLGPLGDKGYAPAQMTLGSMYEFGRGVPQEYSAAVKCFGKTADQDYAHAQLGLGTCTRKAWASRRTTCGRASGIVWPLQGSRYRTSRTAITQSSAATMSPRG